MDLPGSQEASPRLWPEFPDEVEGREEARGLGSLPSSCRVGHILLDAAAILWLKCYVGGLPLWPGRWWMGRGPLLSVCCMPCSGRTWMQSAEYVYSGLVRGGS